MRNRTRQMVGAALMTCGALGAIATSSQGATVTLFTTGFDQAITTSNPVAYHDGALAGQNGWTAISGAGTNPEQVSNSATNGIVSLTTSGEDDAVPLGVTTDTTDSVYLSADVNLSAAQATGDYFLHIGSSTSIFGLHLYAKSSGAGYLLGITPSNLASGATVGYGTTVLPFGTTEHVVLEYDFVSGASNDTAELFVNPSTGALPPTDGLYASDSNAAGPAGAGGVDNTTGFSTANVRQGSASAAPTETVDNIVVSGVAAVPEPASIGLLIGAAGLVFGRRPRRA
jgi:trimeric autotransporter adhesin